MYNFHFQLIMLGFLGDSCSVLMLVKVSRGLNGLCHDHRGITEVESNVTLFLGLGYR